ncbi:MAG: hypothetical protein EB027_06715, partial [Actinobacteria bacterium]|nr:hypothetical protein [Actinomycetota bacterium]
TQLRGGSLTVSGNGLDSAGGAVTLQAGGPVVLDAQAAVTTPRAVSVERLTTVAETVDVVVGETSVAVGQVQVPEYSWVQTQITEQVGSERVKVGSSYLTMDVTLTQLGYYNPKATDDAKFREVLVEGLDYFNDKVDWNANGTEGRASVSFGAAELAKLQTTDYKNKTDYKGFTQLTDVQRQAVLNHTGYMPLFQFSHSNAVLNKTLNGNVTATPATLPWADNVGTNEKVYYIDVAGWRDKYVRMPVGAEADILRVTSQAEALYLAADTTNNGQSDGTWMSASDIANTGAVAGEWVGRYKDTADVTYTQDRSVYYFPEDQFPDQLNLPVPQERAGYDDPFSPQEDGRGRWSVDYALGSGDRVFDIASRSAGASTQTVLDRDPNWTWESTVRIQAYAADTDVVNPTAEQQAALADFQGNRATDNLFALETWIDALAFDTASTDGLKQSSSTDVPDREAFTYKYWGAWDTYVGMWVDNDDGSRWGDFDDENE